MKKSCRFAIRFFDFSSEIFPNFQGNNIISRCILVLAQTSIDECRPYASTPKFVRLYLSIPHFSYNRNLRCFEFKSLLLYILFNNSQCCRVLLNSFFLHFRFLLSPVTTHFVQHWPHMFALLKLKFYFVKHEAQMDNILTASPIGDPYSTK